MRNSQRYTLFSDYDGTTGAFTAATTDIITDAAHGLVQGDPITASSTTTLPAGMSAETVYYVLYLTAGTFKLSPVHVPAGDGAAIDITDTGTGTHTWVDSTLSRVIFTDGFKSARITIHTSDTVDMTVKCWTSDSEDAPNPLSAATATNDWDYAELIDKEDQSNSLDGDTGLVTTTAETRRFNVNTDGARWVGLVVSRTNGTLDATIRLNDNQ